MSVVNIGQTVKMVLNAFISILSLFVRKYICFRACSEEKRAISNICYTSDFPKCPKKAIECMFIHPEVSKPIVMPQVKKLPVPCKFFPYCTNPLCPYMHPAVPQYMQAKPSFATTGQRVQIPCKNGDACTRPDCHFIHPKDPPAPQSEIIVSCFVELVALICILIFL